MEIELRPLNQEVSAGLLAEARLLWMQAPAWRLLVISTGMLMVASASLYFLSSAAIPPEAVAAGLTTQSATPLPRSIDAAPSPTGAGSETQCSLSDRMGRGGRGRVLGFLSQAQAEAMLERTQLQVHAAITPAFKGNVRAIIALDDARKTIALIPNGMTVKRGDLVAYVGGRRDPSLPCNYVPNLIQEIVP